MNAEQEEMIDWHNEATAVIEDVKDHVKKIAISDKLITGQFKLQFFSDFLYCLKIFL